MAGTTIEMSTAMRFNKMVTGHHWVYRMKTNFVLKERLPETNSLSVLFMLALKHKRNSNIL